MTATWMDLYSERYAFEVAGLERVGFQVDEEARVSLGLLAATGTVSSEDFGEVPVTIVYPDGFPFLRPEVFATTLNLGRHQNPFEGNLCLLDRNSAQWNVDDTGEWLVTERVPKLLGLLTAGSEVLASEEAPQGEPWLTYLRTEPGTAVFVPEAALEIDLAHTKGAIDLTFSNTERPSERLRLLLRRVSVPGARHGTTVAQADATPEARFASSEIHGRWLRLRSIPKGNDAQAVLGAAVAENPDLAKPRWQTVAGVKADVIGCLVEEEIAQGVTGPGWVFVVRLQRTAGHQQRQETAYLIRGERYSPDDLSARVPRLHPLRNKHVVIVGLGALGAPIAIELARCGVGELTVLDGDVVEAGNTIRWPFGISAVGWAKAQVVADWLNGEYPYTRTTAEYVRLGQVPSPDLLRTLTRDRTELELLQRLASNADLVIDATAELGVQHLVSAAFEHVPQLFVSATEGGAGGMVARVRPPKVCWVCLQWHIEDRTLPEPTAIPGATLQPRGCAQLTFEGTSFDLATVSNQAVRVAISELIGESAPDQDISVCSLRDGSAWASAPRWETAQLQPHSRCTKCSAANAA